MREINVLQVRTLPLCSEEADEPQGPRALLPAWGFWILERLSPLIPPLAHAFKSERTIMTHAADRITAVKRELVEMPIEQRPRETAIQRLLSTPLSTTGQLIPEYVGDGMAALTLQGRDLRGRHRVAVRRIRHRLDHLLLCVESSSIQLTSTDGLWHLATHLDVQDKLYDELKRAIEDREQIPSAVELETLPYLRGYFLEVLRLYSAAPSHLPRVVPDGGLDVLGYHIPAGPSLVPLLA